MKVPFMDLSFQLLGLEESIRRSMEDTVRSGRFILGPEVSSFEKAMADYHKVRHAIGVASGTDALVLALLAGGVRRGDEVITTPFTFVATAESIAHTGARPVFADIDERTFNLDPAQVEKALTDRSRAILPVHLYGLPAEMDRISTLAKERNLLVIEDCAQSTGARVGDSLTGSLGTAGAFSFFPTKNLGGFGDGGMVLTGNSELAQLVRELRGHGATKRDHYERLGFNSRLDTIQAAVLAVKLERLDEWNALRRRNADLYRQQLADVPDLQLPVEPAGMLHVYNQFTIMTEHRDELKAHLAERDIGSMVYYSENLHLQPLFGELGYKAEHFPVAERVCRRVLSLPVYPGLAPEQVEYVAAAVRDFFGAAKP
jgi:dTDP-4-amino-4,6-dideoxygalactose transaminase